MQKLTFINNIYLVLLEIFPCRSVIEIFVWWQDLELGMIILLAHLIRPLILRVVIGIIPLVHACWRTESGRLLVSVVCNGVD